MAWSALPDRVLDTDLSDNPAGNGQLCAFREIIDIMNGTPEIYHYDLTVNSGTGDGSYNIGTEVIIAADAPPSADYVFDQWTGDVANVADLNDDTTTITMPAANTTVTASYVAAHNDGNILKNFGFENPVVSSYQSAPFTEGWTFSNVSGVQRNGSLWGAEDAPEGVQTCFLQWGGASISQSFNVDSSGYYLLKCQMARGDSKEQPVEVYLDGTSVNTFTPESSSFAEMGGTYYLDAGVHTIEFKSTASKSLTTFIDDVYFGMQEPVSTIESKKMQDDMGLKIYPNPTNEKLFIEIPENPDSYREGEMSLRWIDITGKTLDIESSLHSGINTISMEGFSRGLYFIQISSEGATKMFKIIKN
jgi:hypothetical protein